MSQSSSVIVTHHADCWSHDTWAGPFADEDHDVAETSGNQVDFEAHILLLYIHQVQKCILVFSLLSYSPPQNLNVLMMPRHDTRNNLKYPDCTANI